MNILSNSWSLFVVPSGWIGILASESEARSWRLGESFPDNSRFRDEGYKQNVFEIGGKGTLRGYGWKAIPSSHYQLSTLEIWYSFIGLFYDRAIIFDSPGNTFNQNYLNDMIDNIAQTDYHSIGIGFQPSDESRLSFVQALSGNKETTVYLTYTNPIHYW